MSSQARIRARVLWLAAALAGTAGAQSFPPLPAAHEGARVSVVASGLHDPRGLALGPDGSLYVADSANFAIRRITPDGTINTLAGPASFDGEKAPTRLAVTSTGTVYVSEQGLAYGSDARASIRRVRLGECGPVTLEP